MSRADAILRSALVLGAIIWPPNAFLFTYALFEVALLIWIAAVWLVVGLLLGVIALVRWHRPLREAFFPPRAIAAPSASGLEGDP